MAELFLVPEASAPPIPRTDAEARASALDIGRSWIVEAPAGSGKTGLLIQRFLKLLAHESVTEPGAVLAVTFTRKATVELRDRILAQLSAAATPADYPEPDNDFDRLTRSLASAALARDREFRWGLLDYPRRLNIRTIDSLSADIARSLPVLSGAGGSLTPIDQAEPLYAAAAHRTMMLLGGDDPVLSAALETLLLHRDANLADCERLIASMLPWRDQWGELIPLSASELSEAFLDGTVLPKIEKALDQAICRGLTRLSNSVPKDFLRSLCALAAEMGDAEGYGGSPSPISICANRYDLPGVKSEHLAHWHALIDLLLTKQGAFRKKGGISRNHLGFMVERGHKEQLAELIARVEGDDAICAALCQARSLPPAKYPADQWPVAKALFRVLSRALVELQLLFADRGECDFAELGLLARFALRRDGGLESLTEANGAGLQHLLVDEMQDTSTGQYELIQLLTRTWDGYGQTVFLVGDPKQSIYLFREARVERFVHAMRTARLGDLPLGVLHLTANFRSQADLVHSFNHDFSRIFPAEGDLAQPDLIPYLRATTTRPPTSARARVWHTNLLPSLPEGSARTALTRRQGRQDAQEIRRQAQHWLDRPLPPGRTEPWKIAVLVRNRNHLPFIIAAFKQPHPIAYRAVDIEALGERQEVLDLFALTRALLHPADRTAWLALLRTPWCGLTLPDLHLLAGADDPSWSRESLPRVIATRGDLLTEDGVARLRLLWSVMEAAGNQRGRLPLSQWVERTWRSFSAHRFSTPEQLGNVARFLTLLDKLELPGGTVDIAVLAERLRSLYATAAIHPGAVDLMTIHGSKGLEWDVVIVPAMERGIQSSRSRLLSWLEVDGGTTELDDPSVAHGILAPIGRKGTAARELNEWMRSVAAVRESAERKRLFYVACTRAREELHLFASPVQKRDGSPPANSLLAASWPAAMEHFAPPSSSSVVPIPRRSLQETLAEAVGGSLASLAASTEPVPAPTLLFRIPLEPSALEEIPRILPYGEAEVESSVPFERPEGSFTSRAFGNTVHALLEHLAARIAAGQFAAALLAELPAWSPRILGLLRSSGLAPAQAEQLSPRVFTALRNTLTDPEGRWIVSPHPGASAESSLMSWNPEKSWPSNLRLDRTFLAGPTPLAPGEDHRWIIDFKTATLGGRNVDRFLAEERGKYAGQLQTYADASSSRPNELHPIRLALFYPMLPRLVWWEAGDPPARATT